MTHEARKRLRSKVAVNIAVYVWAFVAMLAAPILGIPSWWHTLLFYVWLLSAMAVVGWPMYVSFRYGIA
jgi:uncharacterized membrane protein